MKDAVLEYEIVNWDKYNKKSDAKNLKWVAMYRKMISSCSWMDHVTFRVWCALLCDSIEGSGRGHLAMSLLSTQVRSKINRVSSSVDTLKKAGMLRGEFVFKNENIVNITEQNRTKHNITISSELSPTLEPPVVEKPKKPKPKKDPDEYSPTFQVWLAYVAAHVARYGTEPDKNAKVMNQCKMLIERVGFENAKNLVSFYLQHNDAWYVKKVHVLQCCVNDAEGLMTQMRAKFKVTSSFAHDADRKQTNQQVFENFAAERGIKL